MTEETTAQKLARLATPGCTIIINGHTTHELASLANELAARLKVAEEGLFWADWLFKQDKLRPIMTGMWGDPEDVAAKASKALAACDLTKPFKGEV